MKVEFKTFSSCVWGTNNHRLNMQQFLKNLKRSEIISITEGSDETNKSVTVWYIDKTNKN